jgi:hypothetical protein
MTHHDAKFGLFIEGKLAPAEIACRSAGNRTVVGIEPTEETPGTDQAQAIVLATFFDN